MKTERVHRFVNQIKAILMGVICICLIHTASAETPLWTEGALELRGHTIRVHAIVKDTLPSELHQIKIKGKSIPKNAFHQNLEKHFTLHPDFSIENFWCVDDFYISEYADDFSAIAGYYFPLIDGCEVEQIFPIEEPELRHLYGQCVAFLADSGIAVTEDAGYIGYSSQKGSDYIIALLPYQMDGLSTEYRGHIVRRDSLQYSDKTGQHIMDQPWADFVFDCQNQLLKVEMSSFQVSSSEALSGQPIAWEQAAETVLEAVIDTQVGIKRDLENKAAYNEDQFWMDYDVRLSRALPMWMPDWFNVCVPGWCIQYQLYDRATGEFVYAQSYCADALTGKVAW